MTPWSDHDYLLIQNQRCLFCILREVKGQGGSHRGILYQNACRTLFCLK